MGPRANCADSFRPLLETGRVCDELWVGSSVCLRWSQGTRLGAAKLFCSCNFLFSQLHFLLFCAAIVYNWVAHNPKMSDDQLTSALNLMRRMPPSSIENSLAGLIELVPQLTEDLLNHVDQPLKVQKDLKNGRDYILCDYNRDGDSYR